MRARRVLPLAHGGSTLRKQSRRQCQETWDSKPLWVRGDGRPAVRHGVQAGSSKRGRRGRDRLAVWREIHQHWLDPGPAPLGCLCPQLRLPVEMQPGGFGLRSGDPERSGHAGDDGEVHGTLPEHTPGQDGQDGAGWAVTWAVDRTQQTCSRACREALAGGVLGAESCCLPFGLDGEIALRSNPGDGL